MTTAADLATTWRALPVPAASDRLEGTRVAGAPGVWAAKDSAGRQHLLVEVASALSISPGETRGLHVTSGPHRISGTDPAHYLDLQCSDEGALPTFTALGAEVVRSLAASNGDRAATVLRVVREWKWFWGVDPDALSRESMLGLFGELWFLRRWLDAEERHLRAWQGSEGSRHDFQWPACSVEVKTTSASETRSHEIQNLEQLADPETGTLYLFSLRVAFDALAANSVATLVDSQVARLAGDVDARATFLRKVAQRGYSPGLGALGTTTLRVVDERLYEVGAGFPRLTARTFPDGLPAGITSVAYRLDLNACEDWLTPHKAGDWSP